MGFGDIVGLMQDFEKVVDEEQAEKDAQKMLSGQFDMMDFSGADSNHWCYGISR